MNTDTKPAASGQSKLLPEELSPEWFVQAKKFLQENKNTDALTLLEMLQVQISRPPMIDEIEVKKRWTWDPNCRTCHGTGRIGVNLIYNKNVRLGKHYQLQMCHCAKEGESEYARVEKMLTALERNLQTRDRMTMAQFEMVYRHTAYGGKKVLWGKIRKKWLDGYEALMKLIRRGKHTEPSAEAVRRPAEQG